MRRTAITLVELLVVCAAIMLMSALLLSGVQQAREHARRAQCASNLRQIGSAIHSYHAAFGFFPPGASGNGLSMHVAILPQVEQMPLLASHADYGQSAYSAANASIQHFSLPLFHCPSDSGGVQGPAGATAGTNYAANFGTGVQAFGYNGAFRGIGPMSGLYQTGPLSSADITDGLSQTAALSEQLIGDGSSVSKRQIWTTPQQFTSPMQLSQFAASCASITAPAPSDPWSRGRPWSIGDASLTWYNHILGPNQPSCTNGTKVQEGAYSAASQHVGGVNLIYADGHSTFIDDEIDGVVWVGMGSRNGRDLGF